MAQPADLLYQIASYQLFDGSFNLDSQLTSALRVNLNSATQEASRRNWNPKAYATALTLAFFKEKLSGLKDDWELIADKSRIWLISNAAGDADAMFDAAVRAVTS